MDYEQPIVEIVFDDRSLYRRRKVESFLKAAVGDLHLLKGHPHRTRAVASAAGDVKLIALNVDLDVFGRHARKLDL